MRLFTIRGIELCDPTDLQLLDEQNKKVFVSFKGQEFNAQSCLAGYHILRKLGEGGFGKVVLAEDAATQENVAIKFLKIHEFSKHSLINVVNAYEIDKVFKEVKALENLSHQNIVKLKNSFPIKSDNSMALVMEYASGAELLDFIVKRGQPTQEEARTVFRQIVSCVSYCHKKSLIHRDLKLENILLSKPDAYDDIRVVDFGISGFYSATHSCEKTNAGSLKYMPPEVLSGKNIDANPAIDIWSMGCILHALVLGKLPFRGKTRREVLHAITTNLSNPKSSIFLKKYMGNVSNECRDLIYRMLQIDPEVRIQMKEIQSHPWIAQKKSNLIWTDEEEQTEKEEDYQEPSIDKSLGRTTLRPSKRASLSELKAIGARRKSAAHPEVDKIIRKNKRSSFSPEVWEEQKAIEARNFPDRTSVTTATSASSHNDMVLMNKWAASVDSYNNISEVRLRKKISVEETPSPSRPFINSEMRRPQERSKYTRISHFGNPFNPKDAKQLPQSIAQLKDERTETQLADSAVYEAPSRNEIRLPVIYDAKPQTSSSHSRPDNPGAYKKSPFANMSTSFYNKRQLECQGLLPPQAYYASLQERPTVSPPAFGVSACERSPFASVGAGTLHQPSEQESSLQEKREQEILNCYIKNIPNFQRPIGLTRAQKQHLNTLNKYFQKEPGDSQKSNRQGKESPSPEQFTRNKIRRQTTVKKQKSKQPESLGKVPLKREDWREETQRNVRRETMTASPQKQRTSPSRPPLPQKPGGIQDSPSNQKISLVKVGASFDKKAFQRNQKKSQGRLSEESRAKQLSLEKIIQREVEQAIRASGLGAHESAALARGERLFKEEESSQAQGKERVFSNSPRQKKVVPLTTLNRKKRSQLREELFNFSISSTKKRQTGSLQNTFYGTPKSQAPPTIVGRRIPTLQEYENSVELKPRLASQLIRELLQQK